MIVGVAGYQNSGKTTLIELLLPQVSAAGFSVATVKHIAHDDLRVDAGGSDTQRHRRAGARLAAAVSESETVYFHGGGDSLDAVLARLAALDAPDLIIVEGFKGSPLPKIVVGKVEHGGEARWRWDGTREGAEAIGRELIAEVRAERGGAAKKPRRAPRGKRSATKKRRPKAGRPTAARQVRRADSR